MSETILCALISAAVTLLVSIGTWQVSIKKDRDKAKEELKEQLTEYYEKNRKAIDEIRQSDLQEIRDDVTDMGATLQSKIAVIEEQIRTLSTRVEKHNNVIERVFKLEQAVTDLKDV